MPQTKRKWKDRFKSERFYTMRVQDGGHKAVPVNGLRDIDDPDILYYSINEDTWFAIDRETGAAIATAETHRKVYNVAHTDKAIKMLNDFRGTEKYKELVAELYREKMRAGAYKTAL